MQEIIRIQESIPLLFLNRFDKYLLIEALLECVEASVAKSEAVDGLIDFFNGAEDLLPTTRIYYLGVHQRFRLINMHRLEG